MVVAPGEHMQLASKQSMVNILHTLRLDLIILIAKHGNGRQKTERHASSRCTYMHSHNGKDAGIHQNVVYTQARHARHHWSCSNAAHMLARTHLFLEEFKSMSLYWITLLFPPLRTQRRSVHILEPTRSIACHQCTYKVIKRNVS